MAGGWTRDGAVNDQIEADIADALARLRRNVSPTTRESLRQCAECDEPIPEPRRAALPGVRLCLACQTERDAAARRAPRQAAVNRRAGKDSQLK